MKRFIHAHKSIVTGAVSGFDRIRFRGTLRRISNTAGMLTYLTYINILLKDFGNWSQMMTKTIRSAAQEVGDEAERPVLYLQSPKASKEEIARKIAKRDKIESGTICLLEAVEPCWSF